ncbi:DNA/RNA helicase, superfamily I [Rhizobium leguminosarum bv. viciae WSM1455]|nr:DNA/RNA helicase, superfamily I [Rhizobium leguminosarum bv. viciae WSM1455]
MKALATEQTMGFPSKPDDTREREAILGAGPDARMLVEAGPGTGKTQLSALRLAGLIRGSLSPGQVLVLSFSRSAVRTLTRRLTVVAAADTHVVEELRYVSIRTFDSWAFRVLRLLGHDPSELLRRSHDENINAVREAITGPKRDRVRQLIGDRRHLIIDEFQDLPGVRGELVLALLNLVAPPGCPGRGFTILGDPAQAIYGFAAQKGAMTPRQYWEKVQKLYGSELAVHSLQVNHRATESLAALSAQLRSVLLGNVPDEEKLKLIRTVIADLPAQSGGLGQLGSELGSKAILTRTNGEAVRVLQNIMGRGVKGPDVPVKIRAANYASPPPAWIAGLLRPARAATMPRMQFDRIYERLASIWDDEMRRRLDLPARDVAWARLMQASGAPADGMSLDLPALRARLAWPDSFPDDEPFVDNALIVTTVHQSKGMEFDIVTLLDKSGDGDNRPPGGPGEEASVGYVGVTRAARALCRSGGDELYPAPRDWNFPDGRSRLYHWRNGWLNLEIGQPGDIFPVSFVDPALHGSKAGVDELQAFLLKNARNLEGHKVVLCKQYEEGKVSWTIHLQEDDSLGKLLGRTAPQLTYDLLNILHEHGLSLPSRIFNLRISAVGTLTSEADCALEEPDKTSRLWLGISLFGIGDIKTGKRATK